MTTDAPALLGGRPAFPDKLSFARPTVEDPVAILELVRGSFDSGQITDGPLTRQLEESVATAFDVDHCVAVSSATVGLMLVIQALQPRGPVLMPSFTFAATAHAAAWNGAEISFADCSSETWCLTPSDVVGDPALIVGVHLSGVPCNVADLRNRAEAISADLIYDAAHGAGSRVPMDGRSRPVGGFGRAEVFSLTPTKVMSGVEGGLVTTNDADLAKHLRIARNYGNPGDYDSRFPGLNARMSELHAAVALSSLEFLKQRVDSRGHLARVYREGLGTLEGIEFQHVPEGATSSYKDFTIVVDPVRFGCDRNVLATALKAEGIETRKYYSPPVHRQRAYSMEAPADLPVTDRLASRVLTLPMWSHLPETAVERVVTAIARAQSHAGELTAHAQVASV